MWQKYNQLSLEERHTIYELLQTNQTKREIAHRLNRSASTITREIERNKTRIRYTHKTNPKYHYLPDSAQAHRNERRRQANYRTPLKNEIVKDFVLSHLKIWWSPDIISGVLRKKYGKCQKFNISHETIYKFIYKKENWGLNLKDFLLRKHKRRKQKTWKTLNKKSKIPNRLDISERSKLFPRSEIRKEFWHFEWDSILSKRTTYSAIHTEVERVTRFIFAQKMDKKSAENVEYATISIFSELPKNSIKSTTWDNGTEHANHEQVTTQIWIPVFFAEPYKSWQRWTNEHANGMIRRFFPKWTNFDKISENQIQIVVNYLNNRPRKILNYRTSQELFDEEIKKFKNKQ